MANRINIPMSAMLATSGKQIGNNSTEAAIMCDLPGISIHIVITHKTKQKITQHVYSLTSWKDTSVRF
jgi:uncharacterized protein (UPF0333 family)